MAALSSEGAMTTPLFTFQHSMVPRLASSKKKTDAASSPKSVIPDMHLPSPGSSSSNSKCLPHGLDQSYSTSDGEFSELDYVLDSIGNSQELDKVLYFLRVVGKSRRCFASAFRMWPLLVENPSFRRTRARVYCCVLTKAMARVYFFFPE